MLIRLFSLKGVPDDEAEEIRELLTGNEIDYYETPTSKWGISTAALWLKNEKQLKKANLLITKYQEERTHRAREEYEKLRREGKNETIVHRIKQKPIRVILYLTLIITILYLSIKPFMDIGK
jgi:hypothetical protein